MLLRQLVPQQELQLRQKQQPLVRMLRVLGPLRVQELEQEQELLLFCHKQTKQRQQ
jgi:hypothetical protein